MSTRSKIRDMVLERQGVTTAMCSLLRWSAVYGATVAAQVRERYAEGRGPPEDDDMLRFVDEAEAVADMSEELFVKGDR